MGLGANEEIERFSGVIYFVYNNRNISVMIIWDGTIITKEWKSQVEIQTNGMGRGKWRKHCVSQQTWNGEENELLQRKIHDECKMGGIKPIMSMVTVNGDRLTFNSKKAETVRFYFKKSICKLLVKICLLNKRTKLLKMKRWEKIAWKDANEEEVWNISVK